MPTPEKPPVVAYVLRKFPKLSETFVLNEILGLEAHGVKVQIFSLMPPRDPRYHEGLAKLKAPIWYVPGVSDYKALRRTGREAGRRYGPTYRRALAGVLAKGRPKLVWRFLQAAYIAERSARLKVDRFHAHFATRATTVAGLVSSITGKPYSFTAHAVDIYRDDVNFKILGRKMADADFTATVSQANMEHLRRVVNGSGARVVLLRNGINLKTFAPNGVREDPPFTIVSVARLVEKKGCEYLIEACKLLVDRGAPPFRCLIIGRGKLRKPLQARIESLGLGEHVRLLGGRKQSYVLKRYRSAYLYALPSIVGSDGNREGLPVSVIEALACGLPVVSTSVAGIPEAVQHEHNGLLVPQKDSIALADAMERLLRDRELYLRLQANARSSVEAAYDFERTTDELRRLFVEGLA